MPQRARRKSYLDGSASTMDSHSDLLPLNDTAWSAMRSIVEALPELALPREVARVLRCSERYVADQCRAGRMRSSFVAGRYLIPRKAVYEFLRETAICPSGTVAPISPGDPSAKSGSSTGMIEDEGASVARALLTAQRLISTSRASSSNSRKKPSG